LTAEIAKEAIDFIARMYQAFDSIIVVLQDPRGYLSRDSEIPNAKPQYPVRFSRLYKLCCNNSLVEAYLGKSLINNNRSECRDIAYCFKHGLVGERLISIDDSSPLRLRFKVEVRDKKRVL
jgi:hypothetical protein